MDFDQFCLARSISEKQLVDCVTTYVGLEPNETLYVSGSLLEALGNARSDLDLFLITDRQVEVLKFGTTILIPFDKCVVDLEIWSHDAIDSLVAQVHSYARAEQDERLALAF